MNTIGTQMPDPINSGLARRRFTVRYGYTLLWRAIIEEGGEESVSKHIRFTACVWRMSRLTRDGTAEPVSRDQILRRYYERGQGISNTG